MKKLPLILGLLAAAGLAAFLLWPDGKDGGKPAAEAPPTPIDPATAGTISGTVRYEGPAPAPAFLDMSGKAECSAFHKDKVPDTKFLVKDGRLQNAVVYVRTGLEGLRFRTPAEPAAMDQKACLFEPRVLAARAGQDILFLNSDPAQHNVHTSPESGSPNDAFNLSLQTKGVKRSVRLEKPEVGIRLLCDFHPWMVGWLCVFSHPAFQVTGEDGAFSLAGLPPGDYEVIAWHEILGTSAPRKVRLDPKGAQEITLSFPAKP